MNERDRRSFRRRKPPTNPSPSRLRRKPIAIMSRCSSEPAIPTVIDAGDRSLRRWWPASESENLIRPMNCTDNIFASSPSLLPSLSSHENRKGYEIEAKVVVTVTVEGSPGEVRTMVKLRSTVEDAINEIVVKYNQEKRTPKLLQQQQLELHHSYFSLQCLDKSEIIGDIGSRSFYLRKSNNAQTQASSDLLCSQMVPRFPLPSYFARTIQKILRRTRKLWKILICSQ